MHRGVVDAELVVVGGLFALGRDRNRAGRRNVEQVVDLGVVAAALGDGAESPP